MGDAKTNLATATGRAVLMVSTLASLIIYLVGTAKLNNPATSPFNTTIGNQSAKYHTDITPSGATFAIWGLIYTWTGFATIYVCSLLFRKSDGKPLFMACQFISSLWCLSFSLNILIGNLLWSIVYLSGGVAASALILIFGTILLIVALVTSVYQLDSQGSDMTKRGLKVDIWLTRILVQNATAIYLGWTSCATLLNGASALVFTLGVSMYAACWIALAILLAVLAVWFTLETFAFDRQLRYVFGHYIAYLFALVGIYTKNFDPNVNFEVFAVVLLGLTVVLALTKVVIMVVRSIIDPIVYQPKDEDKKQLLSNMFQAYKI